MDLGEFAELQKLIKTMEWLGPRCVIAGLRPGIVAYIVSAGLSVSSLRTAIDLERALQDLSAARDESTSLSQLEFDNDYEYESDNAGPV